MRSYFALWMAAVGLWATPNLQAQQEDPRQAYFKAINTDLLKGHIYFLADDALEGRETGERGQQLASVYIRSQFMRMGLAPGNPQTGGYYQPFYLNNVEIKDGSMSLGEQEYSYRNDFVNGSGGLLATGKPKLTFVGYGLNEGDYNNLAGVDLDGKVALMLAGQPGQADPDKSLFSQIREWRDRAKSLSEFGSEGVLMVLPDSVFRVMKRYARSRSTSIDATPAASMPVVFISEDMGQQIIKTAKGNLDKIRKNLATDATLPKLKMQKVSLKVDTESELESKAASNVVAFLPGTEFPEEVLVITGHYDHVGVNRKGEIHNGADDDASGTSTVMAVAEAFAQAAADGYGPRRSILFMTVSGEEKGLLGSSFYTDHPLYPLANTVANLNIDMVGRIDPKYSQRADSLNYVYLIGSDRLSTDLHRWSESVNEQFTNLTLDYTFNDEKDPNRYYYRSDHYNFAEKGIPVIFYFNGTHADYHKPTDDPEKIRFEKVARIAGLVFATAWEVANQDRPPVVDVVVGED
ncbi:MAG: M28 family peptidase [Bacteroidota bacterium]